MKITVIGIGYVGRVSGNCCDDVGRGVLCLDIDAAKVCIATIRPRRAKPVWSISALAGYEYDS